MIGVVYSRYGKKSTRVHNRPALHDLPVPVQKFLHTVKEQLRNPILVKQFAEIAQRGSNMVCVPAIGL